MNELSRSIQELPLAALVPVALAVIVGLLLWAAGRRLLRPGFAAAGLLLGGAIGWIVGENVNMGVPAAIPAIVLGIVFAAVAALTYRLAVAVALGLVLGVGGPMAVVALGELQPSRTERETVEEFLPDEAGLPGETPESMPPPADDLDAFDRWLNARAREHFPGTLPGQPLTSEEIAHHLGLGDEVTQHVSTVKNWAEAAYAAVVQIWNDMPERLRPALLGAAATGAMLGLLIGALAPGLSASVVTAFGGGLLWLTGVRILAEHLVDGALMPTTGSAWLILWVTISAIGLSIQWMFRPKRADKSEH